MNSSISSSDPAGWRWFCRFLLAATLALAAIVYAFIAILDPFDTLPLSPPLDRSPVTTNARYAFPALARNPRFDSVVLGTSTSRLLNPAELDRLFGAHFANLAMNSATAYEQWRLGTLFARHHPAAKAALIGIDIAWCQQTDEVARYTERSFPEWMYDDDRWEGYLEIFNLYAVEQTGIAFGVFTGIEPRRYGRDGYTVFTPDESKYDLARARKHLYPGGAAVPAPVEPPVGMSDAQRRALRFPALRYLASLLAAMPEAEKIVFFVPYHVSLQPRDGSTEAIVWDECKARVAAIVAARSRARLVDFMLASAITREDGNYWDPLHYRTGIATWLAGALRAAADGPPRREPDYHIW